jgi:nucleoprotein TPR
LRSTDLEKQIQSEKLLVRQLELNASDLGRQVQNLLRRLALIENPGLEDVPILPPASDNVLSADLALGNDEIVLFQNIASLQAQNQLLLKVAHGSALALDQKEREFREMLEKEETEAMREATDAIATLEEQLETQAKTHQMKLQAALKELELHKSKSLRLTAVSSEPSGHPAARLDASPQEAELRGHLDAYRMESERDAMRLRENIGRLQQEVNRATAELAKANGTVQFLNGTFTASSSKASIMMIIRQ